jgi:hypothetical protein
MLDIFPCNFVYYTKIKNHEKIKEKYLPRILCDHEINGEFYKNKNTWNCDTSTSFFAPYENNAHLFDEQFYEEVIWEPLRTLIGELDNLVNFYTQPEKLALADIWYNIYDKGQFQECHDHAKTNFSGIYLLDLNEENKTMFYQHGAMSVYTDNFYSYNTKHIEEGNVIIFPSNLLHSVNPCESGRITISFNIDTLSADNTQ